MTPRRRRSEIRQRKASPKFGKSVNKVFIILCTFIYYIAIMCAYIAILYHILHTCIPLFTSQPGGSWAQEDLLGPMSPKKSSSTGLTWSFTVWLELVVPLFMEKSWDMVRWEERWGAKNRKTFDSSHCHVFKQIFHRMIYQRFINIIFQNYTLVNLR